MTTKIESQALLLHFKQQYPSNQYQLSNNGVHVQRFSGAQWRSICLHHRDKSRCKECGGNQICKHRKIKSRCTDCNGGQICKHKKRRVTCKECEGSEICVHQKRTTQCKECDGSAICRHKKRRAYCAACGGSEICEHSVQRATCYPCQGRQICIHKKHKAQCAECCGTQICVTCKRRKKQKEDYCFRCHPEFIETGSGSSKIACKFFDELQTEIQQEIQHSHYDVDTLSIIGEEHRPIKWAKKPVDGYYVNADGKNVAVEFLGDQFHGHPRLWHDDEKKTNLYNVLHKDRFEDTEKKLKKLKSLNYVVMYIWESDYVERKRSVLSICHTFDGTLKW